MVVLFVSVFLRPSIFFGIVKEWSILPDRVLNFPYSRDEIAGVGIRVTEVLTLSNHSGLF